LRVAWLESAFPGPMTTKAGAAKSKGHRPIRLPTLLESTGLPGAVKRKGRLSGLETPLLDGRRRAAVGAPSKAGRPRQRPVAPVKGHSFPRQPNWCRSLSLVPKDVAGQHFSTPVHRFATKSGGQRRRCRRQPLPVDQRAETVRLQPPTPPAWMQPRQPRRPATSELWAPAWLGCLRQWRREV
jgi:hypothetical protein